MSTPKSRQRRSTAKHDAVSALQATLDRQEVRRKVLLRRALTALAAGLVILAAGVVLLKGNPAVAGRGAPVSENPARVAAIASAPATVVPPVQEPTLTAEAANSLSDPEPTPPKSASRAPSKPQPVPVAPKTQNIRIGIGVTGYSPSTITASAGSPISLTVEKGAGCAAGFLMPALNVAEDNTGGPVTIDLGRVPAGSYEFTCGMQMIGGTLIVK